MCAFDILPAGVWCIFYIFIFVVDTLCAAQEDRRRFSHTDEQIMNLAADISQNIVLGRQIILAGNISAYAEVCMCITSMTYIDHI